MATNWSNISEMYLNAEIHIESYRTKDRFN